MTHDPSFGQPADHEATYQDAVVYFQYVFAGPSRPPEWVASKLLDSEIAETVSSPVDGQVRMSPRFDDLASLLRQSQQVRNFTADIQEQGWKALVQHPAMSLRLLKGILGRRLRRSRAPEHDPASDPSTPSPADGPQDLTSAEIGPTDGAVAAREASADWMEEVASSMTETEELIVRGVAERQAFAAIQHARESDLYQPSYLQGEPYLRLTLRPAHLGMSSGGDTQDIGRAEREGQPAAADDIDQSVPVQLLAHRSGVFVLSIPVELPSGWTTSQLITAMRSDELKLAWAELSEPVLETARAHVSRRARLSGKWLDEVREGTRWRRFDSPWMVADIFTVYLQAIERTLNMALRGEAWFCHTSAFVQPQCCSNEDKFVDAHEQELRGLRSRYHEFADLRPGEPTGLAEDSSIIRDHSAWIDTGSALVIAWDDAQPLQRYDSHLWTLLVVENYLLQHWQVRCLASDTAGGRPPKRSYARQAQRTLVHGLSEYYSSELAFGTAQDIVAKLRRSSGVDRTHAHLTARIGQLEAMLASERAEADATRAMGFSVLAVVATALLAFPALRETLALMSDLPSSGWAGATSAPLRWLAARGAAGSWGAFLALLLVIAVVWVWTSVRLWGRQRRNASGSTRLSRAGTPWVRGTIEIVREERPGETIRDPETGTSSPEDGA